MRNYIFIVSLLFASIISLASCQKELAPNSDTLDKEHIVIFKANLTAETKTQIDASGTRADWIESDKSLFHVFEDSIEAKNISVSFSDDHIATITATFSGDNSSSHEYTAFVANENNSKKPVVKDEQNPTSSSFDPDADILFAKPINVSAGEDISDGLILQFKRVVAVNKMTIKGIEDGETIQKVVISGSKAILWSYNGNGEKLAGSKLLTINTTSSDVYFITSAVNDVTLTASVTTDKAVYTKTFGPITFKENAYKPFGVTFTDRQTADKKYVLVTDVKELAENDIIVIGSAANKVAAGAFGSNSYFSSVSADFTDYVLTSAGASEITLGKDGDYWTLTTNEGQVGATKVKSLSLDTSASGYVGTWSISISGISATITNAGSSYGSIFYNSTNPRFTNYTSTGMSSVEIYKLNGTAPVTYSISLPDEEHGSISSDFSKAIEGELVTLTVDPDDDYTLESISVTDENNNSVQLNSDYTFTMPASNVTITATFTANSEFKTVTYTVSSKTEVTTTGTAPSESSATYSQTYSTMCQMTSGNTETLTLSGFTGKTIAGITLSMKSNASKGSGYLSATAGSTTIASIGTSSNGVSFNNSLWNGSYSTSYSDVSVTLTKTNYTIQEDEDIVIVIGATANSLYCQSFTIIYK